MNRGDLTNSQWERLHPLLPPQTPKTGRPAHDHRTIINGILWMLRTGAPWRDLPERDGPWRTVASRFYRGQRAGIWAQLFAAVQAQADAQGQLNWDLHDLDGTMIRAHQHAAGAKKGTQSPKPSAAAAAGSVRKSICGLKGVAS
jgi:transposase